VAPKKGFLNRRGTEAVLTRVVSSVSLARRLRNPPMDGMSEREWKSSPPPPPPSLSHPLSRSNKAKGMKRWEDAWSLVTFRDKKLACEEANWFSVGGVGYHSQKLIPRKRKDLSMAFQGSTEARLASLLPLAN